MAQSPSEALLERMEPSAAADTERDEFGLVVADPTQSAQLLEDEPEAIAFPDIDEGRVRLPGGFIDSDGRLLVDAEVRELNGADEEALARAVNFNPVRFIDTIVQRCLVSVGGRELSDADKDSLLIGDRDMIVLGVRRATYGDVLRLKDVACPICQHKFDIDYSLTNDVPVKELDDPSQRNRQIKLRKRRGQEHYADIVLLDGGTQKKVFGGDLGSSEQPNVAELNTLLLRHVVQRIDGLPVMQIEQVREGLSAPDRAKLLNYIEEHQPGPRYGEVSQTCPKCEQSSPLPIGLSVLFQPDE